MIGIKLAGTFILLSTVLAVSATKRKTSNLVQISEEWFHKHGCPVGGEFQVECNTCKCLGPAFYDAASCTKNTCDSIVVDFWHESNYCAPGMEMYIKCSKCKCDKKGHLRCDYSACLYYSDLFKI